MNKKLLLICISMVTAGAVYAIISGKKENLTVPESAQKTESVAVRMKELGSTKSIPLRAPEGGYTAPVTFTPTKEQFDECTLIDLDGDGKSWSFNDNSFRSDYNFNAAIDQWCILPAVNLEAATYKISYTYKTKSDQENFALMLGNATTPEAMTKTIFERLNYSNSSDVSESTTVEITTAGQYYLGLHSFSDKNKFYIYFTNISIEKIDFNRPKSPEIAVEAIGYDCTVSVTLPTQNIGGETLVDAITTTLLLDGKAIDNGTFTGAPGESKKFDLSVSSSGYHTFSAIATVGDLVSEPAKVDYLFSKIKPTPIPMGYVFAPDEDEYRWCTIINSNNDNSTWEICTTGFPETGKVSESAFRYTYSWTENANDWIILPAFDGSEGGACKLNFSIGTKYNKESMEVYMAYEPTVEALLENQLWANNAIDLQNSFKEEEVIFPVEKGRDFYIAFHASSPKNSSYIYVQGISVNTTDGTVPMAPVLSDVKFDGGDGTIALKFPSENLAAETLDPATTVIAEITLDGEPYGEPMQGKPGETKTITFSGLALGDHTVTAASYITDADNVKKGGQTDIIEFKCRIPSSFSYSLPLDLELNTSCYDNFLIVDANEDGTTWTATNDGFRYHYNSSNPGNDWFISPAIEITDPSQLYEIAITAKSGTSYEELFQVFLGREQSVEAMTTEAIGTTSVKTNDYVRYAKSLSVPEAGRYYIGVKCVSEANKYDLYINRLEFKAVDTKCPDIVTDLTGDGLETGELFADISFKFPTVNTGGEQLGTDLDLTATVKSNSETKTVYGKPGEETTVRIACPAGISTVEISVSSVDGEGPKAYCEVLCGLDKPSAPVITGLTVAEDNMSVKIDYAAITTGASGGHVNASNIDYYLWEWDAEDEDWYQIDVTDALSMTYELYNPNEPLCIITLGLQAYNGMNSGSVMTPFTVVLGKPYVLPMTETFEQGKLHYSPIAISSSLDNDYAPTWKIADPMSVLNVASEEGGYALCGHTSFNRGDSFIYLPKFSTENMTDAEIEFSTYLHKNTCEMTLMATTYGLTEYKILGSVEIPESDEGWKKFKYTLPAELQGKKWVDARLYVNFTKGSIATPIIDSYSIRQSSVSGITDETVSTGSVIASESSIIFTGFANETAIIYTPAGLATATLVLDGNNKKVDVTPGIYIVVVAEKTYKVAVK